MKKKAGKGKKSAPQKMEKPKRNQQHLMAEAQRITMGENTREARKAQEVWKMLLSQQEKAEKKKQRLEKKKQKEDQKETLNELKKAIDKRDEEDLPVLNLEVDMTINKLASEVDLVTPPVRPTEPQIIQISDSDDQEEEMKAKEEPPKMDQKDDDKVSSVSSEFVNEPQCFAFLFEPEKEEESKTVKKVKADFVTACSSQEIEEMNEQAIDENIDIEGIRKVQARCDAILNSLASEEEKLKYLMQWEVTSRDERSHESRTNLLGTRKHTSMKLSADLETPVKRRNN